MQQSEAVSKAIQSGQTRRPLLAPSAWVRAATRCGFSVEPIFKAAGIDLAAAFKAAPVVTLADILRLMRDCNERAAPGSSFPLALGETCAFDNIPAIETFITTSPTMRATLRALEWISELMPMIGARLIEDAQSVRVVLRRSPMFLGCDEAESLVETAMVSFYGFMKALSGDAPRARKYLQVCFAHNRVEMLDIYGRYFQSPIKLGQSFSGFIIPSLMLDIPLAGAVPELHRQAENAVRGYLARLAPASGMSVVVERLLSDCPEALGESVERVAERLGLHHRTLQRRLREDGLQYSQVQDRVWLDLATRWLEDEDTDIDTIGLRLGYASGASFARAFKRLAGMAPGQFRGLYRGQYREPCRPEKSHQN